MKAVIQSLWLLTIGLGSSLVIVITGLDFFERPVSILFTIIYVNSLYRNFKIYSFVQAMQFFSYSVIMLFGTVIFIVLAYQYKPNDALEAKPGSKIDERKKSKDFVLDDEEIRTIAVDIAQ